jgi:hypothetical protein
MDEHAGQQKQMENTTRTVKNLHGKRFVGSIPIASTNKKS